MPFIDPVRPHLTKVLDAGLTTFLYIYPMVNSYIALSQYASSNGRKSIVIRIVVRRKMNQIVLPVKVLPEDLDLRKMHLNVIF